MNHEELEYAQKLEQFGRAACRTFHKEGVELGLFKQEDYDIIFASMSAKVEEKLIVDLQEHFDTHFEKGEDCA
jgi:hypothetical protein